MTSTTIDAREADRTDGPYQPHTLRLALHEAMTTSLTTPGASLRIARARGSDGAVVDVRKLQICVRQIIPAGWKVTTERDGDALEMWRLR